VHPVRAAALVVAYVVVTCALAAAVPALVGRAALLGVLRDPIAVGAVVVGVAAGGALAFRMERDQPGVGFVIAFLFAGGVLFLATQLDVPGALGNLLLAMGDVALAAPGLAFAAVAPALLARRGKPPA
jgi:hypothetical protein